MTEIVRGSLPLTMHGRFKPWSIDSGHSKVLLRGFLVNSDIGDPPRVFDVLFQDVSRISIGDLYLDLCVTIAEEDVKVVEESRLGVEWPGLKMFLLRDGVDLDYIVAGFIFWAEVTVRANVISPLMAESLIPGAVEGNIFRA